MSNGCIFLTKYILLFCMLPISSGGFDHPVADFFVIPTSGWDKYYDPEYISVSTGEITSYHWDFGDGSTSTELIPNHKYTRAGLYTITLIVTGPGGADTLKKEDYLKVEDFAEYPFPTYIIDKPDKTAWDSVLNIIQASQLDGFNPGDLTWWGSSDALKIKHGGGGRILFGFSNDTIFVDHHRDFFGDNLIVDGENKNVHFYYDGPDDCGQTEGQDALIRIHGNDNVFRNVGIDRFPEGIHLRGGSRNLIENVTVNIVCEDAMTMNGSGNKCIDCIIRNCSYQYSEDKTIMVNDGGSLARMVITGCYFNNGNQPIRMTGGGLLVVRHCEFTGNNNNGPRLGGKENLVLFENNYSHGTKSGLRLSDKVSAIVRNNIMEGCRDYGIRIYKDDSDCLVRIEKNTIRNNGIYGVIISSSAQVDLGGGSLDIHRYGLHSGPGTVPAPSIGNNVISKNGLFDLFNQTGQTIKAENNRWDHQTVPEVLALDVKGDVDVDPLHPRSNIQNKMMSEIIDDPILLERYPNPFNDSVAIHYYLHQPGYVTIDVFDISGKRVNRLVSDNFTERFGKVYWNGRDKNNHIVSSGIYYIKLIVKSDGMTNEYSATVKKVVHVE